MMTKYEILFKSGQRVFNTQDLFALWKIKDKTALYSIIQYYVRTGKLKKIYKGTYALGEYTSEEFGQKIVVLSYVSFYTALAAHGIIFQFYDEYHFMATISKKISTLENIFVYHKLNEEIFFDSRGIEDLGTYQMASPERAICDSLYLVPGLAFDSLNGVDLDELLDLATIYNNVRLLKEIRDIVTIERSKNA